MPDAVFILIGRAHADKGFSAAGGGSTGQEIQLSAGTADLANTGAF